MAATENMAATPADRLVTEHAPEDATVTVRLVKSFAYRTVRLLVLHHVDLSTTTPIGLRARVLERTAKRASRAHAHT
jgi:hypothetical protein